MSVATKIAAGIATTGAVGGALALGSYSLINTQNIQGRLKEEDFEILDTEKDEGWDTILSAYKKAKSNTFQEESKLSSETTEGLRKKCKDTLNKKSNVSASYLLARQWCVKERTVTDILEKQKFKVLKTEATVGITKTNKDDDHWTTKSKTYSTSNSKHKIKIDNQNQGTIDKEKIKAACKALNTAELKTTSDGFNEKLEQVREWCTIKKTDNN
ncbi:hypothetical protein A6V39_03880 [Candidatus Mycoplasma haematobovis]|uniref:Uncharacterized protein n=1 Tax=Candidatus Mycoplasma haematobovis TaxID=432608 RepID=A0A1A9QC36_9MOLU|nr:hypothetical protein [Candidatus Mycoplasma haematobovis]OAL10027.1 hypothetical protein A6V39_03880 [Candidatus Mycoplasma haematobovis]